jgi:hypothetical protein
MEQPVRARLFQMLEAVVAAVDVILVVMVVMVVLEADMVVEAALGLFLDHFIKPEELVLMEYALWS